MVVRGTVSDFLPRRQERRQERSRERHRQECDSGSQPRQGRLSLRAHADDHPAGRQGCDVMSAKLLTSEQWAWRLSDFARRFRVKNKYEAAIMMATAALSAALLLAPVPALGQSPAPANAT